MQKRAIFITGGAGVLGESLIACLADDYRVICLTRRSSIADPRVESVRGDIGEPQLGLDDASYAALAANIDWVIHSAAITQLDGDEAAIERANYQGTVNMLALAERARVPMYHVSTAYTHDCDFYDGVMPATPYERAKKRAEKLVLGSGQPVSVFKPSMVIGDAATGVMPNFQGFHMTLALSMSGILPIVPCAAEAFADVVARDVAARAIRLALDREVLGETFYLTSGDRTPTVGRVAQVLAEVAESSGQPYFRPRCMQPDVFERLVKPVFLPTLPAHLQPAILRASLMCRYGNLRTPLPSSLPTLLKGTPDEHRDPTEELRKSVQYLQPKMAAFRRMLKAAPASGKQASDASANTENVA